MDRDRKTVERDTLQLKKRIDEHLHALCERVEKREQGSLVTIDELVDDVAADIITPVAHYVRKILRRHGIDPNAPSSGNNT